MANHHQAILRRCCGRDLWGCEGFAESDVLLAAQQLMQLSDRENGCSSIIFEHCKKKKQKQQRGGGVELEPERALSRGIVVTSSSSFSSSLLPMEEVFRGEEGICWPKKRRRRYRDLADIYDATVTATATEPVKC